MKNWLKNLIRHWHPGKCDTKKYTSESVSNIKTSDNKICWHNAKCFFLPTILEISQIPICDACVSNGHRSNLKLDLFVNKTV